MKKALFFAGLAAATLAFVGCNKEADIKGLDAAPFEIVLSEAQTRTVNDGMNTKWADNDKISLFHAEAGTTDYKNDTPYVEEDDKSYPYTISDVENGVFQGTLMGGNLEEGKSYDWYVLYPFNSYLQSPVNTEDGRTYIGGRSDRAQVQAGYDSKAHLAGGSSSACFPLYGLAKNIPANETPTIAMKHVASVAAVTIKNDSGSPIKISQVEFTAPEPIVGNFFISFEKEPVTLAPYSDQVSATAVVTVTNPAELAVGESATVYMGIKPFTAASGDKLSLKITTSAGVLDKELTLTGSVEFKAGTIKHLNVSYSSGTVVPTITVADIKTAITSTSNSNPSEFTGQLSGAVVSFVSGSNAFIQDETGGILYYKSGHGLKAGDVLNGVVSGKGYIYNGLKEITSLAGFEKTSGSAPAPVSMTLAELLADYDRYMSVRVKLTGVTVAGAFENRSTTMTDGDASLTLRDQKNGLTITAGQYDITGHPGYYNANQFGVWAQEDIVIAAGANVFDVTERQISVDATATSAQIQVTGNVDWTVDPDDNIKSVDPASGNGEGTVTVTFDANTDTENPKEYTVFLRTTATGVEDEIEVTIIQAKASPAGETTVTVDFSKQEYENAKDLTEAPVTINGVTMTFDKGTNGNGPKYYTSGTAVRMYGDNSMTVTVPATRAAGMTIKSIVLEFGSGDGSNPITTDVATYEEGTWTGEAASVTFTIGGTTGQRRIKGLTVTYSGEAAPASKLASIAVTPKTTEFFVGDTFVFDGTVTATYEDGSTKDVTASAKASSPDMTTAGTKTVTVSYTEGEVTKQDTYEITVAVSDNHTLSMTMAEYVSAHECKVSAGSDVTVYKVLKLSDSVRMSTSGEPNCGSFWGENREWRLYQNKGGDVTVSVAEGCSLKSVTLTFGTSNNGVLLDAGNATIASGKEYTVSGSSVTYTVGNSGTGANGQVKITAVKVVYTGEGTFPKDPDDPVVTTTVITMTGSALVYVGETYNLNATSNVPGAPITYESEDTAIATVDASGVVTGVAEGSVKVYARIAASEGVYTATERYCTVTVAEKPSGLGGTWEAKALADIADGTQFILVSTNADGASYAMSNDKGTTGSPLAVSVTVTNGTISNPESNIVFTLKVVDGGYNFTMEDGETWLYTTKSNSGLRVGTGANKVVKLDSTNGYLNVNDSEADRYIGVYNATDWRGYKLSEGNIASNIAGQTFSFFVKK